MYSRKYLTEHAGTKGCSVNWNVPIREPNTFHWIVRVKYWEFGSLKFVWRGTALLFLSVWCVIMYFWSCACGYSFWHRSSDRLSSELCQPSWSQWGERRGFRSCKNIGQCHVILYSRKFSNGANFRMIQKHATCVKITKIYFGRTCQKKKSNECGKFEDGTLSFLYEASPWDSESVRLSV